MFSSSHRDQSRWKPSYIKRMLESLQEFLDELGRSSKRSCVRQRFAQQRRVSFNGLPNHPGVESPEQLGRTGRHGGLLKAMVIRVIAELQLVGREAIQHALTQSVMTKNSMLHRANGC